MQCYLIVYLLLFFMLDYNGMHICKNKMNALYILGDLCNIGCSDCLRN